VSSRTLESFLKRAVKESSCIPNVEELQRLLHEMCVDDLQEFWMHFVSGQAFSTAETAVSHWKTREKEAVFEHTLTSLMFYPKDRDETGKYIVVKDDLANHIKVHLIDHIRRERARIQEFRSRPFFERLVSYAAILLIATVWLAIPAGVIGLISDRVFHTRLWSALTGPGVLLFALVYGFYLVIGLSQPVMRRIAGRRRKRPDAYPSAAADRKGRSMTPR
jgi:hypothetical protein